MKTIRICNIINNTNPIRSLKISLILDKKLKIELHFVKLKNFSCPAVSQIYKLILSSLKSIIFFSKLILNLKKQVNY